MLFHTESLEEMRERHKRELAAFRKTLRRERYSMFVFLAAWLLYILFLPFTSSPDQIMLLLGILLLFYGQFLVVMLLD